MSYTSIKSTYIKIKFANSTQSYIKKIIYDP